MLVGNLLIIHRDSQKFIISPPAHLSPLGCGFVPNSETFAKRWNTEDVTVFSSYTKCGTTVLPKYSSVSTSKKRNIKCVTPISQNCSSSLMTSALLPATTCFCGLRTTLPGSSATLTVPKYVSLMSAGFRPTLLQCSRSTAILWAYCSTVQELKLYQSA